MQEETEGIRWPEQFAPSRAPVYAKNELMVKAPVEAVWEWLVSAPLWPSFYPNSADVVLEGGRKQLSAGTRFTWKTFGVKLKTQVEEFIPKERIAWRAKGFGVDAYHAWLLRPLADGGCHLLTEETQYGWLARLGKIFKPHQMQTQHQIWLEALAQKARRGRP